jgi:uncharacterized membrane protein YeaQ/YmgE (transglycosylase-associated protein family)
MFGFFGFILWIIVGGISGYIAELLMGEDHSLMVNVGLGIAGAFLINVIISVVLWLPFGSLIGQLVMGVAGACLLILAYREYKKRG